MMVLYFLGLIVGVFGLVKVTDKLIHLIKIIGHRLRWPTFIVSSIFLAAATSFPEMFVGITSAVEGLSELSLGNILGANLTNITLVLGLATVISGGVATKQKYLLRDLIQVGVIALTPYLLMLDGQLSRIDGAVMLAIYAVYTFVLVEKEKAVYVLLDGVNHHHRISVGGLMIRLLGWLALLGGLAQLVVWSAEGLADMFAISALVIGLLVLSLGTTLPELVVEIESADKREPGVFFGNILGSLTVNSSLILGLVALIRPISLVNTSDNFIPGLLMFTALGSLLLFMKSKHRLERREGFILLFVYLLFLVLELV